jgi:ergothioneine biosynthesis protein EgtB
LSQTAFDVQENGDLLDKISVFYLRIRKQTEELSRPLKTEDFCLQVEAFVSPAKWHLAHTTWFFEKFILCEFVKNYKPFDESYFHFFNSYYEGAGSFHPQGERGLISRPTTEEAFDYRKYVDEAILQLLASDKSLEIRKLIEIGLNHEQQHQELFLMDIKYNFYFNPLKPTYLNSEISSPKISTPFSWSSFEEGLKQIGHSNSSFAYDNESPRHKVYLQAYQIANRLVTCGEYLEFIEAGGYQKPELWLSDGWAWKKKNNIEAPLYWKNAKEGWRVFSLYGEKNIDIHEPVCHASYYEADAFARWKGVRLPREAEWENAATSVALSSSDHFSEQSFYHPGISLRKDGLDQMHGSLWEFTQSAYQAYPGYKAYEGTLGEYNGKFMCNQMVLRGGSCVTTQSHYRPTYRNFFYPHDRWAFAGIRLAKDIS